jgi:DUF4097 and DUF4098 domain-containing protein YvlB
MKQASRAFFLFGVLALPALAGCDIRVGDNGIDVDMSQGRASDEWVRAYPLAENGSLEIININGQIEATPSAGREVEIRVERTTQGNSDEEAQELLRALEMTEQVSADRIRVEGKIPEGRALRRNAVRLEYRIRVPRGTNVVLRTENGGVRVEDIVGRIEASTTNGGVNAEGISGAIKATAVNGGIRLEMAAVTGDVEVSTTNGGVRIDLPREVRASLDATCVNGAVRVDEDFNLQATESSRNRSVGTLNGGGVRIVASTVNGGVTIDERAPRGSN